MKAELFRFSKGIIKQERSRFGPYEFRFYAGEFSGIITEEIQESRIIIDFLRGKNQMIDGYLYLQGQKIDYENLRYIKKYNPKYILADRAYDTEPIRKCVNEEAKAEDQIPLKTRAKNGHYRLKSKKQFKQEIYSRRNNVESIFSVIKRIFNGTNRSRTLQLSNKETKLKNTIYNIYRSTQIQ